MYCRFCGAEIPGDSVFCPKCGKAIGDQSKISGEDNGDAAESRELLRDSIMRETKVTDPQALELMALGYDEVVRIGASFYDEHVEKIGGCDGCGSRMAFIKSGVMMRVGKLGTPANLCKDCYIHLKQMFLVAEGKSGNIICDIDGIAKASAAVLLNMERLRGRDFATSYLVAFYYVCQKKYEEEI